MEHNKVDESRLGSGMLMERGVRPKERGARPKERVRRKGQSGKLRTAVGRG